MLNISYTPSPRVSSFSADLEAAAANVKHDQHLRPSAVKPEDKKKKII